MVAGASWAVFSIFHSSEALIAKGLTLIKGNQEREFLFKLFIIKNNISDNNHIEDKLVESITGRGKK